MSPNVLPLVKGYSEDWPIQTYLWGGSVKAVYASGDTLAAGIYAHGSSSALFNPTIGWFTNGGLQTGYDQGQVLASVSATQAATLEVSGSYTLLVTNTPAADPTRTYPIARIALRVDSPAI